MNARTLAVLAAWGHAKECRGCRYQPTCETGRALEATLRNRGGNP